MSPRITIDADLCQGTAECLNIAPGLVELDSIGIATMTDVDADVSDEIAARLVATCSSRAISPR